MKQWNNFPRLADIGKGRQKKFAGTRQQRCSLPPWGSWRPPECPRIPGPDPRTPHSRSSSPASPCSPTPTTVISPVLYTVKKIIVFSVPIAGMSLTKFSLSGNNLIIPARGEFGEWHPGWGEGKHWTSFYSVIYHAGWFFLFSWTFPWRAPSCCAESQLACPDPAIFAQGGMNSLQKKMHHTKY